MDLMKHENWFLCVFRSFRKKLHPRKLTSHQFKCGKARRNDTKRGQNRRILANRDNIDELELPDGKMVLQHWDSIVAKVFGQSPQPFHQLQLQQQFP